MFPGGHLKTQPLTLAVDQSRSGFQRATAAVCVGTRRTPLGCLPSACVEILQIPERTEVSPPPHTGGTGECVDQGQRRRNDRRNFRTTLSRVHCEVIGTRENVFRIDSAAANAGTVGRVSSRGTTEDVRAEAGTRDHQSQLPAP